MNLHKNLNIEKNLFIRDYTKQGNQSRGLSLQRRDMLDKFWIKNQSPDKTSIQISRYLQKVQRGLNTIERLKLWRSLPHHIEYMDYYKSKKKHYFAQKSKYYNDIKNDVKRTYLHSSFLEGNEAHDSLVNILAIYASRNRDVGYVQGMNFLAGTLFLQCGFDSSLNSKVSQTEEETFSILTTILEDYGLGDMYSCEFK